MIRRFGARSRGHDQHGGRHSWTTFPSNRRTGPFCDGFRGLMLLREEILSPGTGFEICVPAGVQVMTYVREGTLLTHGRSGATLDVVAGEIHGVSASVEQRLRAVNGSLIHSARAVLWGLRNDSLPPQWHEERVHFPMADRRGVLTLVGSPGPDKGVVRLRTDARVYSSIIDRGQHLVHEVASGRAVWLQVLQGRIRLSVDSLRAGDGASFVDEAAVSMTAQEASELLLFDLP